MERKEIEHCKECGTIYGEKCTCQRQQSSAGMPGYTDVVALLYQELLMAVCKKFPGETRHQTALRYIRAAETPDYSQGAKSA